MLSIFPIHEVERKLEKPGEARGKAPFPIADGKHFSIDLAVRLIELCIAAQCSTELTAIQQQGDDLFLALSSRQDPAQLFNVRGQTNTDLEKVGRHTAYGPLVRAYRHEIAPRLHRVPGDKRLWLAGHGVGAAYATLAAVELGEQNKLVAALYTFGSPRVAGKKLAHRFPCPAFRIVNDVDVMVELPPPWQVRHVGAHKLINADGSLNHSPNPLSRLPSLASQTAWLGQMLREGLSSGFPRPLFTLLSRVIGDHAADLYAARLRSLRDR